MNKLLLSFLFFFLIIMSCENEKDIYIDIEKISNSESFKKFNSNSISLNKPYLNKIYSLSNEELEELDFIISELAAETNLKSIEEPYHDLTKVLGYTSIENYEELFDSYLNSMSNLMKEFPELNELSKEEQKEVFLKLFNMERMVKIKSMDCTYEYSYCVSQAEGTYYAGTAICALSALGSPLAALACQGINTVIFNGAITDCLNAYTSCTLQMNKLPK